MTNYEWLVETEKLKEFMADIIDAENSHELSIVEDTWKIPSINGSFHSIEISNWLQAEYKEPDVYVKLEDVINIVTNTNTLNASYSIHFFSRYCADLIRELPTKIMDKQEK